MSELKRRILIADDETVIADTLALILRAVGFESMAVYSGEEAVRAAPLFRPNILISDVIMPGITGIEAAIVICELLPECKVILISGQAATADLIAHAGAKVCNFEILLKPCQPPVLIERVRRLVSFDCA